MITGKFGNYDELPLSKEQMRQHLSHLLGREIWNGGTPFTSEIELPERMVSRKPDRFANDLEAAFREIASGARDVPGDYLIEVILNDDLDNHENEFRDWLFIRVRLVRL